MIGVNLGPAGSRAVAVIRPAGPAPVAVGPPGQMDGPGLLRAYQDAARALAPPA